MGEQAVAVQQGLMLWEKHLPLVLEVREDHRKQGAVGGGHNFLHAIMVAQYCPLIAPDRRVGELAWIAAICHNTDRIFLNLEAEEIARKVSKYLNSETDLTKREEALIIEAVVSHDKPNDDNDSPVTIVLKDADRLANLGPNLIIRSGQYYSDLAAFDPRFVLESDPQATYRNPKTVLHDVLCALEWIEEGGKFGIRLKAAREIAEPYARFLRDFRDLMHHQLEETGLIPYMFPEDFGVLTTSDQ